MKIGILISNLGTPDSPTKEALKRYLKEFLLDERVVNPKNYFQKIVFKIILYVIILRTRPEKSAKKYITIWGSFGSGSPLLDISIEQVKKLSLELKKTHNNLEFALGMRYGSPSIKQALRELKAKKCNKIIILPLYPQKSSSTTLSTLDCVNLELKTWDKMPQMSLIESYYDNLYYIEALSNSVKKHWDKKGKPDKLIISFHGMPQRYIDNGDVYYQHCVITTKLIAQKLNIDQDKYILSFQSVFGNEEWIKPYTDEVIKSLPKQGVKSIQVICPGFAVDCLETLEEINKENREYFFKAGGESFSYIPALNTDKEHIKALKNIILERL